MPSLVLGPLLRYVGTTDATVWVETDAACEVEVLGHASRTFAIAGHHYAIVHVQGLEPGSETAYEVTLDGERVWPLGDGRPASVICTWAEGRPVRIAFGSCRVCYPQSPPYTLTKDEHDLGREGDALRALAMAVARRDPEARPDALLMLGDQIYADEVAPGTREFIRSRRDPEVPPGETLADFEEYTRLYREAWSEPWIRWLLSTVPTAMIFDDHDVHDDWNTSVDWVAAMRAQGWWDERITGAFMSYWLYQHLGNLEPAALAEDALLEQVRAVDDGEVLLREFAWRADRTVETTRWSFCRDIGPARLVMIDSRAARVLDPAKRRMVDEAEWRFVVESAGAQRRHVLLATSLPWLLSPGMHDLEAWNEAVAEGAWGPLGRRLGERLRQGLDLEHWAAFRTSFEQFCGMVEDVAAGRRGEAPATVVALSGDVHHAYLFEVAFPSGTGIRSKVYQAVCSPFRNPLDSRERRAIRVATGRAGAAIGRVLRWSARVPAPPVRWRATHDRPWFDNMIGTLRLDGEAAGLSFQRVGPGESPALETVYERSLTP
jgi:hypothetical protein